MAGMTKKMSDLVSAGSKFNNEQRRQVVVEYYIKGNDQAVSYATGISRQTINTWRLHSDWWDELLGEVRHEIDDQILAQNLQIATKAGENVLNCLENGDEKLVLDKKTGEYVIKHVKPGAYQSMLVSGISQDKARVQLNLPTSIQGNTGDMKALANEFAKLSDEQARQRNRRVVSTQPNVKSDPGESEEIE